MNETRASVQQNLQLCARTEPLKHCFFSPRGPPSASFELGYVFFCVAAPEIDKLSEICYFAPLSDIFWWSSYVVHADVTSSRIWNYSSSPVCRVLFLFIHFCFVCFFQNKSCWCVAAVSSLKMCIYRKTEWTQALLMDAELSDSIIS